MHCNKAQFTTRDMAERVLAQIRRSAPSVSVRRAYRCACGFYHLTSQETARR